jgi:hypothetical protein
MGVELDRFTSSTVPGLHVNDLRRTARRLMRRSGFDSETRRKMMGHKTEAMDGGMGWLKK